MSWKPKPIATVSPDIAHKIHPSGRNQPLLMRCDNGADYIVKLRERMELKEHGLAREIYGSLLADFFNLPTPEIALVDIAPDFHLAVPESEMKELLMLSPGLNFGSMYIPGTPIFNPPAHATIISLAARVFCFDMLICNPDRGQRVNMFRTIDGLIVFDHELAFGFSRPKMYLGGFPPVWEFIRESWSKEHILYASLKGRSLQREIDEFINDLLRLKDNIFVKIEESVPLEWQTDLNKISRCIANTRDNSIKFKRSLQELLS